MEKFIEDLIERYKWENFVLLILLLEIPGMIFVFVWSREIFMSMDIIKLLFFSFSISFLIFIPNLVFTTLYDVVQELVGKEQSDTFLFWARAVFLTWIIIGGGIIYKLYYSHFTIICFVFYAACFLMILGILKVIKELIYFIKGKLYKR